MMLWTGGWLWRRSDPRAWAASLQRQTQAALAAQRLLETSGLTWDEILAEQAPAKVVVRRVREWDQTAAVVGQARQELLAEGKPVFIIGNHYGLVGQVSFYLPEARAAVKTNPLVYFRHTATPQNQFFFWPGYNLRKGENAVFVTELDQIGRAHV